VGDSILIPLLSGGAGETIQSVDTKKFSHLQVLAEENARENAKFTGNAIKTASKTNLRGYHNQRG